ncbi:Bridging integrator 2, partial [Ophiophagus hannah]
MLKTEVAQQDTAMAEGKTGGAGLFAKRVQKQLSRAQEKGRGDGLSNLISPRDTSGFCLTSGWVGWVWPE